MREKKRVISVERRVYGRGKKKKERHFGERSKCVIEEKGENCGSKKRSRDRGKWKNFGRNKRTCDREKWEKLWQK